MKKYINPEIEVLAVESIDIMTTSSDIDDLYGWDIEEE